MRFELFFLFIVCCLGVCFCGCHYLNSKSDATLRPEMKSSTISSQQSNNQLEADKPFDESTSDEFKAAWCAFIQDKHHRMAIASDFTEETQKHINNKIGIYLPLLFDLNGDKGFHDIAVIVVNTTRDKPDNFGLVLFSQPEMNPEKFEPTWIMTNCNLSNAVLSKASARLFVTKYQGDGSKESCLIVRDKKTGKYTCEQR